jgi:hypothetical protein
MATVQTVHNLSNDLRFFSHSQYTLSLPTIPEQLESFDDDILFPFPNTIRSSVRPLFDIVYAEKRLRSKLNIQKQLYTSALKEYNAICAAISISKKKLESIRRSTSMSSDSYLSYQSQLLSLVFKRNTDCKALCILHQEFMEMKKLYTLISSECVL